MRIQVLINYGGRNTGEQRIKPGEYDADDPRVYGIADYLVANGHARVIAVDPPPVADVEAEIETTEAEAEAAVEFEPVENTRAVKRKAK
jgi:hypothetical protein